MKFLLCLALIFTSLAAHSKPEIWLLSGAKCNTCDLFKEVSLARGYGDTLQYDGRQYSIRQIDKDQLPDFLQHALKQEIESNRYWDVQLTVSIVDHGRLLYQGNIAQSADFSQAYIDDSYMRPKAKVSLDELHNYGFRYVDFFKRQFNLEYFIDVAINGKAPRRDNTLELPLLEGSQEAASTVSLWGTAMQPARNGLFIATRINQIQDKLTETKANIIFAHGKDSQELDTLRLDDQQYSFIKAPVKADFSADIPGLQQWLSAVKHSTERNHLIIQVGHSGPNGAPVWGHALPINQALLAKTIAATEKDTVLISGACHSGLFAKSASCGFYAAHPDAVATGCQTSLEAIEASDDYLKHFFGNDKKRDLNKDGKVSFNEAHWYASSQLEYHNISYTDTDAEVDDFFKARGDKSPKQIALDKLQRLAKHLNTEERYAFKQLSKGLPHGHKIDLDGYISQHNKALHRLNASTEILSSERNKISKLTYPLNLSLLARRAIYKSQAKPQADLQQCENQIIDEFIR